MEQERTKIIQHEKQQKAEMMSKTDNASTAHMTNISDKDRELLTSFTAEEKDEILK